MFWRFSQSLLSVNFSEDVNTALKLVVLFKPAIKLIMTVGRPTCFIDELSDKGSCKALAWTLSHLITSSGKS